LRLAHNHLSQEDRARIAAQILDQILRGDLPVIRLHNKPKALPTDDELDRLVAMIGADRIMAALDRYTQPTTTV
jgi:hypothetical protein